MPNFQGSECPLLMCVHVCMPCNALVYPPECTPTLRRVFPDVPCFVVCDAQNASCYCKALFPHAVILEVIDYELFRNNSLTEVKG